jgi:hypothetical protein
MERPVLVKSHPPELRDENLLRFCLQSLLEAETVEALLRLESRVARLISSLDPTEKRIESFVKPS